MTPEPRYASVHSAARTRPNGPLREFRRRLVETIFPFEGEKLALRSQKVEAAGMAAAVALPLALVLLHIAAFYALETSLSGLFWSLFLSLATALPIIAFFWGSPPAIGYALTLTILFLPCHLVFVRFTGSRVNPSLFGMALACAGLFALALRVGENHHSLGGLLTSLWYRQKDLEGRRNTLNGEIAKTEASLNTVATLSRKITDLVKSSPDLGRELDLERVAEAVTEKAREILGRGRVLVYRFGPAGCQLLAALPPCPSPDLCGGEDFNPIVRRGRRNELVSDLSHSYQIAPVAPPVRRFSSLMLVPLATGFEAWGVLRVESETPGDFARDDLEAMSMLAVPATLALQNADLYATLEKRAVTDGLTGLYRRHYFDRKLETELSRARRGGTPLSLIFFDVDHFKSVNDSYGHAQGDVVLKEVAEFLSRAVENPAIAARYGGEEFVLVLPDTPRKEAIRKAEEIRRAVESHAFTGMDRPVTISGGVSSYPDDAATTGQLVESADSALYVSKKTGRNRITAA